MDTSFSVVNFISAVVATFTLVILFLLYISVPTEINHEDKKRIEKFITISLPLYTDIYRAIGGLAYWIATKLTFLEKLNPNLISFIGFLINISGSVLIPISLIGPAGILIIIGGLFDVIDGKVARAKRQAKPLGALVDSVLDRISEIAMFVGIMIFFALRENKVMSILTAGAMAFSLLVSYVRARGESLGVLSKEGIMRRQERVVIISLSLLLDALFSHFTQKIIFINIAIFLVFVGSVITSIERFKNIITTLKNR